MTRWRQPPRPQHQTLTGKQLAFGLGGAAVFLTIVMSCGVAMERSSPATSVTETVTVTVEAQRQNLDDRPTATVTVTVTAAAKPKVPRTPKPKLNPKPQKTTSRPAAPSTDPRFRTCGAANDAGYGPYHRGQDPEYAWYIDRDGDGVACER